MKDIDDAIAELQRKACKVHSLIEDLHQWRMVLKEEIDRTKPVATPLCVAEGMEGNNTQVMRPQEVAVGLVAVEQEEVAAPLTDPVVITHTKTRSDKKRYSAREDVVLSPRPAPPAPQMAEDRTNLAKDDREETLPSMSNKRRRQGKMSYREACEVCGRHGLDTLEKLRAHLKTHLKDGARTCPIPTCKQVLKNTAGLLRHILVCHHGVERTVGELAPTLLSPDVNLVVPRGVTLGCFGCDARFNDADALDVHIRKHLNNKYPRECNLVMGPELTACLFKAATQDDMARHIVLSHYQVQAECSACGQRSQDHECSIKPQDIEGKRVTVRWLRDSEIAWYDGTVKRYLPATDTYEIFYDDGTHVTENLSMRYWRPLSRITS